jgi:[ribosomal protein S18]-alanine N-acetyltransferase
MTFRVRPMTADDGAAISLWRYPGPWAVYDSSEVPDPAEGFWSVADQDGSLVGFACFGAEARVPGVAEKIGVLDVSVGMRPDLVGQGRGSAFAEAVFAHARTALRAGSPVGTPRLRAVVQEWNERSLRLLVRAGFEVVGHHHVEKQRYVVMERDA